MSGDKTLKIQTVDGILAIARNLDLETLSISDRGCITIQKKINSNQDKSFESMRTVLQNARINYHVCDDSFYRGIVELIVPLPIMTKKSFEEKTLATTKPAPDSTSTKRKWSVYEIIEMVKKCPVMLEYGFVHNFREACLPFDSNDFCIRKRCRNDNQIQSFKKILSDLNEWKVPIVRFDNVEFSYIVIKAENLSA